MKQNQRYIVSGYIAAIVSICYWFIALNKKDSIVGVNKIGNIGCYVLFVSIFILVFLANCMTLKMCKGAVFFVNIGCRNTIILIIFFAVVCILVTPFLEDVWVFSNGITIAILGSGTMFFISNVKVENSNKVNISLLILLFCIFSVMAIGKVNTFSPVKASSSYSIHHSSAYIDSIYNVYHGEGFHGGITDQYGHYALLFLLPLHIFGCSTQTIGIILGILYGFVFSLGMLSFCKVIKSSIVKYFIIIAGGGIFYLMQLH